MLSSQICSFVNVSLLIFPKSALNFSVDDTADGKGVTVTFFGTAIDLPELLLRVIEIETQISTGWVN